MMLRSASGAPHSQGPLFSSPQLRMHSLYVLLVIATIGLFSGPVRQWISLSLTDSRYSHIVLIPAISASFLFVERRRLFAGAGLSLRPGLGLLAASAALYWLIATRGAHFSEAYSLSVAI